MAENLEQRRGTLLGVVFTMLGVLLFSTLELVSKNLRGATDAAGMPPINSYSLVAMRFMITGVILSLVGWMELRRSGRTLHRREWMVILLNGVVGCSFSISLFHFGIDAFANASSAAVVFSANALYTIILARFINGEAWTGRKWLAVVTGLVGISCFIFEAGVPQLQTLGAIGIMSLSAVAFACSVCLTRRSVAVIGASLMMGLSSLVGSVLVLPLAICTASPGVLQSIALAWKPLLYIVLVGTTLAYLLYYEGIRRVSAFAASMIFLLKPVLACVLAVLLRGEKMNGWTIAGTVIVVGALLFVTMGRMRRNP